MKTTYAFILTAITTALAASGPEAPGSGVALDPRSPAYDAAILSVKKRCDDCDDDDYDDGLCSLTAKLLRICADPDPRRLR